MTQRRQPLTQAQMTDNRHNVALAGWPRFRLMAAEPQGDYRPRRHGNWKWGDYSKLRRGNMRLLRACIHGLDRRMWGGFWPALPPPGWRLFPFAREASQETGHTLDTTDRG
jgi:hypothetical protein